MSSSKKLILVIGATGAQGMVVIPALLAPNEDGTPSPYAVRALTRDPNNRRARELEAIGVELFQGMGATRPLLDCLPSFTLQRFIRRLECREGRI